MSRSHRHTLIKHLVQEQQIGSQEELVVLLHKQGVHCTQATLSRDLRDLGVVRKNTTEGPVYLLDRVQITSTLFAEWSVWRFWESDTMEAWL